MPPKSASNETIRAFLEQYSANFPREEIPLRLLSARGFMVKRENGSLFFNKEIKNEDLHYLGRLLNELSLGRIEDSPDKINPGLIHITDNWTLDSWIPLFQVRTGMEALALNKWWEWDWFIANLAINIETNVLEPFIARLIQAISAIGLATFSSCDGHGDRQRPMVITFCGPFNATWFEVILRYFVESHMDLTGFWYKIKNDHDSSFYNYRIEPGRVMTLPNLYCEVLAVADLLLEHREKLLKWKADFAGITERALRWEAL